MAQRRLQLTGANSSISKPDARGSGDQAPIMRRTTPSEDTGVPTVRLAGSHKRIDEGPHQLGFRSFRGQNKQSFCSKHRFEGSQDDPRFVQSRYGVRIDESKTNPLRDECTDSRGVDRFHYHVRLTPSLNEYAIKTLPATILRHISDHWQPIDIRRSDYLQRGQRVAGRNGAKRRTGDEGLMQYTFSIDFLGCKPDVKFSRRDKVAHFARREHVKRDACCRMLLTKGAYSRRNQGHADSRQRGYPDFTRAVVAYARGGGPDGVDALEYDLDVPIKQPCLGRRNQAIAHSGEQ